MRRGRLGTIIFITLVLLGLATCQDSSVNLQKELDFPESSPLTAYRSPSDRDPECDPLSDTDWAVLKGVIDLLEYTGEIAACDTIIAGLKDMTRLDFGKFNSTAYTGSHDPFSEYVPYQHIGIAAHVLELQYGLGGGR